MSGDFCKTEQVTLQENGILRNAQGTFIGRLVVDVDELCDRHNKIGYKQGYRAGQSAEREACAKVCDDFGPTLANGAMLSEAIRARGEH